MTGGGRRIVVITGAAAGIGEACAKTLSDHDWQVIGVDVVQPALDLPDPHVAVCGDVSDPATWRDVAAATAGKPISALVNNAAIQLEKPLLETSVEEFRRTIDVNVIGMFLGLQLAAGYMQDGGAIVNMASVLGFTADPLLGAYSTSKGAVVQLTRNAALSFAARGIRVNAVCPGAVATPLTTRVWDLSTDPDGARAQMEELYPSRRIADPSDIADVVAFLVSDASRAMTGSLVVADGGLTATNAEFSLTRRLSEGQP